MRKVICKNRCALLAMLVCLAVWIPLIQAALPEAARVMHLRFSGKPGFSRFVLDMQQADFSYHWRLSPDKKHLILTVHHAVASCPCPDKGLKATLIKHYKLTALRKSTDVRIDFFCKTPVQVRAYDLGAVGKHKKPRLVVDFRAIKTVTAMHVHTHKATSHKAKSVVDTHMQKRSLTRAKHTTTSHTKAHPTTARRMHTHASHAPLHRRVVVRIVIDPGHGGKDSGAIGPHGTCEKDVVLAISKDLYGDLHRMPGFKVRLTRNRDVFIPLRQRLALARRYKADVFIAIHADAAYNNRAVGASVFALSQRGATSEMARWLAQRANASELMDGLVVQRDATLRSVLLDLSQTHTVTVSVRMGQNILHRLAYVTPLHSKRVEQAAFVVLKAPDIPSLLVETSFLSNPRQERKLRSPRYQKKLAHAIAQGIADYCATWSVRT